MVRAVTDQEIFQMSKDELLLPARSESSCSLQSRDLLASSNHSLESTNISPELGLEPLCDSSSEVSDEGYKSSQGNSGVSSKTEEQCLATTNTTNSEVERPESSMTVGSDCSSTISSEEEDQTSSSHLEDQDGSSSLTIIAASPARK